MTRSASSEAFRRRNLRKGTRSCFECRRRKTRCVFKATTDSTCVECKARGVPCVEQEKVHIDKGSLDRRQNLRERVARLESSLALANRNLPPISLLDSTTTRNVVAGHHISNSVPVGGDAYFGSAESGQSAPVLSLFNNVVLANRSGNDGSNTRTDAGLHASPLNFSLPSTELKSSKLELIHKTLLPFIPGDKELSIILNVGGGWWNSWRQMYPDVCSSSENITLQTYISFAVGQTNPVIIGIALLCIAISFQHLPLDFDYSSLGAAHGGKAVIQPYVSVVDHFVCSEDDLMSSLEGIETILLQCKLYVNFGQARKAWIWIRRGFSYAELIGLADDTRPLRNSVDTLSHRRDSILWHLIEVDRQLSLILGLPFTSVYINPAPHTDHGHRTSMISSVQYRRRLFTLAESIINRNLHDSNPSLFTILEQDHALDDLADLMADKWWDLSALQSHTPDMGDICDRLFTQFWHHQIKSSLHLPFMLRSATKPRYHSNRIACFTSSREMLRIFHILRGCACTRFIHYCQVMDFQAFTAAVILVLGLLGYHLTTPHNEDLVKDADDWGLIDQTIEDLRSAASEPENSVARQSLRALETMRQARYGLFSQSDKRNNVTEIVVPYFGKIYTAPGERYSQTGVRPSSITPIEPNEMQGVAQQGLTTQGGGLDNETLVAFNSFLPYSLNDYSIESFGVSDFENSPWPSIRNIDLDQEWYGLDK